MNSKLELIIESILNEDEKTAKALFHEFVVARSREIYESLMDEEMGGNQAQGFVQDLTNQDEQAQDMGLGEDDEEAGEIELGGDDMGNDFGDEETFGDDGDMGGEEGEHEEIAAKLDDLEAQLAELKSMLGDEGAEGGEDFGGDDMGGEEGESDFDMDGGEEGSGSAEGEEDGMMEAMGSGSGVSGSGKSGSGKMESANPFAKSGSGKSGSGKSGSGASGSGKSGSGKMEGYTRKTEAEIMKEYVDKIGEIYKQEPASGEGKTVGTGGDAPTVNKDSITGPGADFGGTNENIATGGSNENPDGKQFKAPNNEYSKKRGELPGAGQFKNVPGGDAGKTSFKTKEPGHGAEKKSGSEGKLVGSDGSNPVNKTSVQKQNTGKK